MDAKECWVFLVYRLPREPSTPRINLWRKLRRLGVAQLLDGLVALPLDSHNREQFEWLADEVIESGGEASVWIAEPTVAGQGRTLAAALTAAVAQEYRAVADAAHAGQHGDPAATRRLVRRLRGEIRRIRARDYFPPPERQQAEAALAELAGRVEVHR
jgi:hypothetical protein